MTNDPLTPRAALDAHTLALPVRRLDAARTLAGTADIGTLPLASLAGVEVGLWEITPSLSTDVEADEVFVVLEGDATVSFEDGSPTLELRPGSVARLAAGARSTWNVREKLRKLYIVSAR